MKILVYLIPFVFACSFAFGQYDHEAKELLDEVSSKTQSYNSVKIEFESVAHNAQTEVDEKYTGILWQKGDKYKLKFMDAITYFDGKNKWVHMPDVQEVNLFSVDQTFESENIFDNPQRIFTIYKEGFKYIYGGKKDFSSHSCEMVELVPEKEDTDYFKIKLFIDKNKHIKGIKYFSKDGMRVTVTVNKYETDLGLKNDMFSFSKEEFPDAEVIDMRE